MRLDELADLNMGQSPTGDSLNEATGMEFHQGKIYFGDISLGISPTKTNAPTKIARPGDVLICVRAPVGVVNLTDRKICIGRGLAALTPKPGVPARFLLHLLRHHQRTIELIATGSTFASITTEQLRGIEFPVPDTATQLRIAGVLGSIDEKIELNRKKIAELETLAKTIYDYWFVQFDFPDKNGKPYKSSGGKMVWNDQLKREVPEGWELKSLGMIESDIITGKTPSTIDEANFGSEIPFLTIDDLRGHVYTYSSQRSLSMKGALLQKGKFIAPDSLCVSCIGTVGVISFCALPSQTNQQINTIVFSNDSNREYLYFVLKDYFGAATVKTGNTFANMNKCEFASIQCILPPTNLRVEFHSIMRSVFSLIKNAENQLILHTEARDALLPLLMNGQVEVAG